MQIHLLVHNLQQAYLAECIRESMEVPVVIISLVDRAYRSFNIPILDINDLILKSNVLGYHPHMSTLCPVLRRKFTRVVPEDIAEVTERDLKVHGTEYKYVRITKENYDPILVSKLLVLENVIVMDSDLPQYAFYQNCVITDEEQVRSMRSDDLRALSARFARAYKELPFVIPVIQFEKYAVSDFTAEPWYDPQDRLQQPLQALVDTDKEGKQHLKLSPTDGPDSLPYVTLITDLRQEISTCEQMLLQRSWLDNRYPTDHIQWLVLQNEQSGPKWWTWAKSEVEFVTEIAKDWTTGDYIVLYQPGYYYYPHSIYARVKLMMDNPHVNTVCSHTLGAYNIPGNFGYHTTSDSGEPPSATMATRHERYFIAGDEDGEIYHTLQPTKDYLKGNLHHTMDFPYNYNCLRVELTKEERPDKVNSAVFAKLLTFEVTGFMNKLYRALLRENPDM